MTYRIVGNITMNQSSHPYGIIPTNSKLIFDGGMIGGWLIGEHTEIIANSIPCIDVDTTIYGTFKNKNVDSRYFNDMSSVDALSKLFAIASDDSCIYIAPQESPYKVSFSAENQQKFLLKKGTHLTIDGTIHVEPNGFQRYEVFSVSVQDVVIDGVGAIVGDKDEHDYTTTTGTHELGKGIGVHSGASNVVICGGLDISNFTGDCITTGQGTSTATPPTHIKIDSLSLHDSRRQGISVTSGKFVEITNCKIYNIDGTNPSSAVDLEPDHDTTIVENVIVANNNILNCGNGIISNFRHGMGRNVVIKNNRIDNIFPLYAGDLVGIASDNIAECLIENNTIVNFNRVGIQITEREDAPSCVVSVIGNSIIQDKEHHYYDGFSAPNYIPQAIVSDGVKKSQLIFRDNNIDVAFFADALRVKNGICEGNTIIANRAFSQYNSAPLNFIFQNNKVVTAQTYKMPLVKGIFMGNRINNLIKVNGLPNIGCEASDDSIIEHNLLSSDGLNYVNSTYHSGGDSVNVNPASINAQLAQGSNAWLFMINKDYDLTNNYIPATRVYITWDGEKDFNLIYYYLPTEGGTSRKSLVISQRGYHDLPESFLSLSGGVCGLVASGIVRDTNIRVERILTISDFK